MEMVVPWGSDECIRSINLLRRKVFFFVAILVGWTVRSSKERILSLYALLYIYEWLGNRPSDFQENAISHITHGHCCFDTGNILSQEYKFNLLAYWDTCARMINAKQRIYEQHNSFLLCFFSRKDFLIRILQIFKYITLIIDSISNITIEYI